MTESKDRSQSVISEAFSLVNQSAFDTLKKKSESENNPKRVLVFTSDSTTKGHMDVFNRLIERFKNKGVDVLTTAFIDDKMLPGQQLEDQVSSIITDYTCGVIIFVSGKMSEKNMGHRSMEKIRGIQRVANSRFNLDKPFLFTVSPDGKGISKPLRAFPVADLGSINGTTDFASLLTRMANRP